MKFSISIAPICLLSALTFGAPALAQTTMEITAPSGWSVQNDELFIAVLAKNTTGVPDVTQTRLNLTINGVATGYFYPEQDKPGSCFSGSFNLPDMPFAEVCYITRPITPTEELSLKVDYEGSVAGATLTATDTKSFGPPNLPPSANAGVDQYVYSGEYIRIDGGASSDPEGSALTYHWTRTSGPNTPAGTAMNDRDVTYQLSGVTSPQTQNFSLVVTDTAGASSVADDVTVNIFPPDCTPWDQTQLSNILAISVPSVNGNYKLDFKDFKVQQFLEAEIASAQNNVPRVNGAANKMQLHAMGTGAMPSGTPTLVPNGGNIYHSISNPGPAGLQEGTLPNGNILEIDKWYSLTHELHVLRGNATFYMDSCPSNKIYFRVPRHTAQGGAFMTSRPMQLTDGTSVPQTVSVPILLPKAVVNGVTAVSSTHSTSEFGTPGATVVTGTGFSYGNTAVTETTVISGNGVTTGTGRVKQAPATIITRPSTITTIPKIKTVPANRLKDKTTIQKLKKETDRKASTYKKE